MPGGIYISVFSIFLGVSVITGLVWIHENSPARQAKLYLDAGVGVLAGALFGSRIGFVMFRWDYFQNHPIEMIELHLGGYSMAGAVIGWIAAILVISQLIHDPALELSDRFLPLAGCLIIGIWLGCWFEGIAYGFLSDWWWAIPAVDEWGTISNRFPVQLLGALSTLLLLIFINVIRAYPAWEHWLETPGFSTAFFLSVNSLIVFLLSFVRRDPVLFLLGMRLDTWISAIFSVLGVLLLCIILIRQKNFGKDEIVQSQHIQ